jgi:hypothetical protein
MSAPAKKFSAGGQLALDLGEAGAVAGMATALGNAEANNPGWSGKAYSALVSYVRRLTPGETFESVTIRKQAEANGLPPPPDARAWGAIVRAAKRAGLISEVGVAKSSDPVQHSGYVTLWGRG